jgi:predicted dehydrogenase
MKFLCIGAGSIGKRHLRNLLALGISPDDLTAADPRADRREEVAALGVSSLFESHEEALATGTYDAAIVCSPTSYHIPHAIQLAERGIHILMEKPLAHNLEGLDELKVAVDANNVTIMLAYIFRFSPLTAKVRELLEQGAIGKPLFARGEFSEFLPDWHPYEDYRSFYMAEKSQGGGSILDQSHIMDLVHYLLGGFRSVYALNGNLSSLEVNADDYSELLVTLKSGVVASIHTDMFGRDHKKTLEIKGEKGNICWSSGKNRVSIYDSATGSEQVFTKFPTDFNLNYIEELRHFIACCEGQEQPRASLGDGVETMELILAAYKSVATGSVVQI